MEEASNRRIRVFVLILLLVQNSSHALLTIYSRTLNEKFSTSEVVLVAELIKLFVSAYLSVGDGEQSGFIFWTSYISLLNILLCLTDAPGRGLSKLWWLAVKSQKILVLVFMYTIMNLLSYFVLDRIDASVYAVLGQVFILVFSLF